MASTRRLSESVADDIRTMITIEKRFCPGDKIPNENELSRELDVSRTTLREAVRILITNGVLEIRRGLGTYVREEKETYAGMALGSLTDTKAGARDLYEMRLIFEPEAAALAAPRGLVVGHHYVAVEQLGGVFLGPRVGRCYAFEFLYHLSASFCGFALRRKVIRASQW